MDSLYIVSIDVHVSRFSTAILRISGKSSHDFRKSRFFFCLSVVPNDYAVYTLVRWYMCITTKVKIGFFEERIHNVIQCLTILLKPSWITRKIKKMIRKNPSKNIFNLLKQIIWTLYLSKIINMWLAEIVLSNSMQVFRIHLSVIADPHFNSQATLREIQKELQSKAFRLSYFLAFTSCGMICKLYIPCSKIF